MKRVFKRILPAVIAFVLILSGCGNPPKTEDEATLYEKIQNTLKNLETYEAVASVTYISNNNYHDYRVKQHSKASGEYRVEVLEPENVAGNVTIFDGKVICQYNNNVSGKIAVGTTESSERSEIFLTSFIKNYYADEEVSMAVSNMEDDDDITILEAKLPGDNQYLSTEKLLLVNDTLKPKELIIYDDKGKERIVVVFHEIEYNVKLNDNLFSIQK